MGADSDMLPLGLAVDYPELACTLALHGQIHDKASDDEAPTGGRASGQTPSMYRFRHVQT